MIYPTVRARPIYLCAALLVALLLLAASLAGCASSPTHNAAGGYIPACGDLPGTLGDDC